MELSETKEVINLVTGIGCWCGKKFVSIENFGDHLLVAHGYRLMNPKREKGEDLFIKPVKNCAVVHTPDNPHRETES